MRRARYSRSAGGGDVAIISYEDDDEEWERRIAACAIQARPRGCRRVPDNDQGSGTQDDQSGDPQRMLKSKKYTNPVRQSSEMGLHAGPKRASK
jgi:hypothetical protein